LEPGVTEEPSATERPGTTEKPQLDPKNTVVLKIDYRSLATEILNGEGAELFIEGEIDRADEKGIKIITVNLKIHIKE